MNTYDAVVIGGGPAGLQATLTLARMHRTVLMLDSGSYRNAAATHMHNVATHDGVPPSEFRALARKDLAAYDTVSVRDTRAESVTPLEGGGFTVRVDGEDVAARGVVLATGLRDELPDVPGIGELWGTVVAHCPFCHGHELAGRHVAVLGAGPHVSHHVALMRPIASRVSVLTNGEELPAEVRDALPDDVAVRTEPVTGMCRTSAGARVELEGAPSEEVGGLFVATVLHQAAPFAEQLGLTMLPSGCVEVDPMGRTSLPGVHAAGDMAHLAALPMPMAAVTAAAASGMTAAASLVAHLL